MFELHYAKGTIAAASAIALQEANVPFSPIKVDFATGAQMTSDYHAINPKGRVPALVTPDGILTETGAILDYIAAISPKSGLVPTDPFKAAKMRAIMYYLASTMHVNHAHKLRGTRWADNASSHADMTAKVAQNMAECCDYIESQFIGPFVLGANISLADIYLFVVAGWLSGDGVDVANYPKLADFRNLMHTRPSVQTIIKMNIL